MTFDLPIPHRGDRLSAARAAQLHREVRQNRILPSPGIKVIRGPNGTHITVDIPKTRPKDKPLPYVVRFDQDLDSGNGGWKIYLPTEHLLSYAGVDVETSDFTGVTQIQDSNGDDTAWYSLDDIDLESGQDWLEVSTSAGAVTAGFVGDPEEGEEGGEGEEEEEPLRICIAEVSYTPPASTVPAKITIFQSVVGALRVGNDGLEPENECMVIIREAKPKPRRRAVVFWRISVVSGAPGVARHTGCAKVPPHRHAVAGGPLRPRWRELREGRGVGRLARLCHPRHQAHGVCQ